MTSLNNLRCDLDKMQHSKWHCSNSENSTVSVRTHSKICKGHFKTEKLDLPWCVLGNLTVQPSIFIYLPRSGTNWQQSPRATQSFLSVTHDFAQGFCLFGVLILLWLHISRRRTERLQEG